MIFPPIRLSQLHRDLDQKREKFERSQSDLKRAVRQKTRIWTLIREHPGLWAGAAASLLSASGLKIFTNGHNGHGRNSRSKGGGSWLNRLLLIGGSGALKTLQPVAATALKFAIKTAIHRWQNRGRRS